MSDGLENPFLPQIPPDWQEAGAYFGTDCQNQLATVPVWRLIPLLQARGQLHMALDLWLLQQHIAAGHPPTLRFYTWSPCAISLGYHQRRWPQFWQHLTWQGSPIDLVRRPTGGRAVLHQGDLTYAIIASDLSGNRLQVYQMLCSFLVQGWQQLGVNLTYGAAGRSYRHNPDCFGTATGADLVMADGTKFVGSAQLWRGKSVLQHGSMRLAPDAALFKQVFGETALRVPQLPADLQQQDWIRVAIPALVAAARDYLGIHFVLQPLSEAEWESVLQFSRGNNVFCHPGREGPLN